MGCILEGRLVEAVEVEVHALSGSVSIVATLGLLRLDGAFEGLSPQEGLASIERLLLHLHCGVFSQQEN